MVGHLNENVARRNPSGTNTYMDEIAIRPLVLAAHWKASVHLVIPVSTFQD